MDRQEQINRLNELRIAANIAPINPIKKINLKSLIDNTIDCIEELKKPVDSMIELNQFMIGEIKFINRHKNTLSIYELEVRQIFVEAIQNYIVWGK